MAGLYEAYGSFENDASGGFFDEGANEQRPERSERSERMERVAEKPRARESQQGGGQVLQEHYSSQPVVKETFQNSPPYELKNYEKQQQYEVKRSPSYSFWDRMTIKRPEVMKLGVFALVIVLAISLERIGTHYLGKYLSDNIFTDLQELMLRFSYPIGVFLFIWIVKSL